MMLVTIISVTFNCEATIRRTMESVLHQTYENIEYIVIDGQSTDGTVDAAREFQQRFDAMPGRRLTILSEPDQGMYDALNKGARMAKGVLVGQINGDDWYEPDAVETMVTLYHRVGYDAAWGSIRMHQGKRTMIKQARIGKLWTTTHWCHPAMFSRKEMLLQFPYALESMYDDFDYITSVYRAGKKIATEPRVVTNFSFGGMSTRKSWKEVCRRIQIVCRIYRKHGMSRLYWFHRVGLEVFKYLLG